MAKEQELCQGSTAGSISATAQPAKLEQECPDPWHGLTSASTSLLPPSTSQEPLPKPLGTGLGQRIPLSWVEVPTSPPRSEDAIFLESVLVAQQFLTLCDPMDCSTPPCSSLSPRICSNSCPLSLGCHTNISSSIIPFSSCPRPFPASGSFPMGSSYQVTKVLELQHQSFQ